MGAVLNLTFVWLLAAGTYSASQGPPEALERLEASRAAIETAHIEWSWTNPGAFGRHPRFYTTRLAGNESVLVNRGDEDGAFNRLPDGSIDKVQMKPYGVLSKNGEVWMHPEHSWGADHFPDGADVYHLRALGLCFGLPYRDLQESLWQDDVNQPTPRKYSERDEGRFHVVKAESDVGVLEWWLEPECGGELVRLVQSKNGEIVAETRSTLREWDGVWFPKTVAFFGRAHKDGKEPYETIQVHYASFNQPEQPRSFSLPDIGIEGGVHITQYDRDRKVLASGLIYDGEKVVTDGEYLERYRKGEIKLGPTMQREASKNRARETAKLIGDEAAQRKTAEAPRGTLLADDHRLTAWEDYTRRFILRYELNDEQTQKAWLVCHECQAQARGHLAKIKRRLEKVESRLTQLRKKSGEASDNQLAALEQQRRQLMQPITNIFERELKPRLEKLPTRAQRKAAGDTDIE
jgi:hypothetical protein